MFALSPTFQCSSALLSNLVANCCSLARSQAHKQAKDKRQLQQQTKQLALALLMACVPVDGMARPFWGKQPNDSGRERAKSN